MNRLDDTTLRDRLEQRVSSGSLRGDERDQILGAVAPGRTAPRRANLWSMGGGRWLGFAAAALGVILVAAVVLKPPTDQGLASSIPPGSPATAAPVASVGGTEEPVPAAEIFSAQELSDMIGGERVGDVVLANARITHMRTEPKLCPPPEPCPDAVLEDVSGHNVVAVGWRTAPEGEGTRYADDSGVRWLTQLSIATESGLFAFKILADAVEYLGPVVETAEGEIAWSVSDIQAGEHAGPADDLYVVDGWLVATSPAPCRAPPKEGPPGADRSYWCGRSWLTQEPTYTVSADRTAFSFTLDGLHAQWDAYDVFAQDPVLEGPRGAEPRFGTYLVRSAGCPPVVMGDCPVWSMVGRLDSFTPPASTATAYPQEIDGEAVLTVDEATTLFTSSDSAEPFLVGGWVVFSLADCFVPPDFPDTPLLAPCGDGFHILSHSPDRTAESLLGGLRLVIDEGIGAFPTGMDPTVLRVHAHDPRAADCPENYRARCEAAIVVDAVVWPAPSSTPSPTPTDLRWSVEPFQAEVGAQPGAIAEVGGRLIVTGSDQDGPAAWYSGDDGANWSRASIGDDGDQRLRALGSVSGSSDLLLSLGWVYLGGETGNDADRRSVLWASTDLGATWARIPGDSVPPRIHDVVAGGPGFIAVGNANPSNAGRPDLELPHAAIWVSTDAQTWEQLPDEQSFQLSRIEAIAESDGQLVAVGSHGIDEGVRPAVWTSLNGRDWSRNDISASFGAAHAIAAGPDGFVAVGISGAGTGGWSATAWLSPDGITWTPQLLDETAGTTAGDVAVNQAGFVAVGSSTQTSEIYGSAWFVPVGVAPSPQTIKAAVGDLVGMGDRFLGVGRFCGPNVDCPDTGMLVIGRPVGGAKPEP